MLPVQFWFDVGCEWTWLTAEWVGQVHRERDIDVRWRVYSLTLRKLGDTPPISGKSFSLGAARMLEAVWADHGDEPIGPLYQHIGEAIHVAKADRTPAVLEAALAANGLPGSYAAAAQDEWWDGAVRGSMADADALAGDDVAVPILALGTNPDRAFSGPVFSRHLDDDTAVRLWDAYAVLVCEPAFFELKRHRTDQAEV